MSRATSHHERLQELLADEALGALSAEDAHELAELLPAGAEEDADDSFALAAAAIALADVEVEPMPAHLTERIVKAAQCAEDIAVHTVPAVLAGQATSARPRSKRPDTMRSSTYGWLAAAACLLLALGSLLWRPPAKIIQVAAPSPSPPTPAEARAELLRTAKDVVRIDWSATKDPAARSVSGDVVWSSTEQRGYMRFHGLGRNDKTALQYQLWIFDKLRDQRYPIDGGVFDSTGEELIVPITAKLLVSTPTLFAVTVEKPGGVVVSQREHIVVTAAVKPT